MRCTSSIDSFAAATETAEGIAIDSLHPGTALVVETLNTTYRFVILAGGRRVLVVGGAIFPEPTVVRFEGATAGGSGVKMGWILVGCQIEMRFGSIRIRTSRVRSLSFECAPAEPR